MCEICRGPPLDAERETKLSDADLKLSGIDPNGPLAAYDPEGLLGPERCGVMVEKGTDDDICCQVATWVVKFNLVEKHLCNAHRSVVEIAQEAAAEDVFAHIGEPGPAYGLLPIEGEALCEFPSRPGHPGVCGARASWVSVGSGESYYCDRHRNDRYPRFIHLCENNCSPM